MTFDDQLESHRTAYQMGLKGHPLPSYLAVEWQRSMSASWNLGAMQRSWVCPTPPHGSGGLWHGKKPPLPDGL